jgi:succinoglycan biosynthesis transport protein ExoP
MQNEPEDDAVQRRTFRDYYIILRERLWIALPIALLVALSYGYWKARVPKLYAAVATLQFEKPTTVVVSQTVVDSSIRSEFDINTYVQDMQSNKVRAMVIDSLTPDEQKVLLRPYVKNLPPGQPAPGVGNALGSVSFEPVRNSFLIRISVTHEDPEAAAIVANKYVEKFMDYLVDNTSGKNEWAVTFLQERAAQLKKDSEDAEGKLEAYLKEKNMVSLDSSMNLVADALRAVQSKLTDAKLQELNAKAIADQIAQYQAAHRDLLEIQWIADRPALGSLRAQLSLLQQKQAALSDTYGRRHPKMIEVNGQIEEIQKQIGQQITQAIADLQTDLAEAHNQVKALQAQYEDQTSQELALKALTVEYNSLKTQADVDHQNYVAILDRLNENTTTKNIGSIPLHILDTALPNYAPIQPIISSIVRTSVIYGLLVFVGVAMGLSFIDDRIKSAWDVEAFIGVNLLGIIPDLSAMKGDEKHSLVLSHQQTPGVEAFLGVYSAVKIQSKLDFPKAILVTSTIPGEGKTLVSSNLAGGFARHGKKTLLVDCDLRRPMLHRHFKQQNSVGLITWFESGASLEGQLATNPNLGITKLSENFSILTSGGRSKSPTSMLEQPAFGQLIEKLKKEYDVVVVDSPPMGAVTDALLIAERTDEVIYVCRFNRAYRKHIKLYIRALLNGKNAVLGIVLNGLSPRRIEYYSNYRYYRSYKKYYGSQS